MSAVRDCLFNIFAATLLIGGRSFIRNPRSRHAAVIGTHLSHGVRIVRLPKFSNLGLLGPVTKE